MSEKSKAVLNALAEHRQNHCDCVFNSECEAAQEAIVDRLLEERNALLAAAKRYLGIQMCCYVGPEVKRESREAEQELRAAIALMEGRK